MYWTLDILLDKDPSMKTDKTGEWENQINEESSPKLKFPLKIKDDLLKGETIEFKDPIIKEPLPKKKEVNKSFKVIDNKKRKNNTNNLF